MRSTATFTISLPPDMAKELERVRKADHRSRSELVREALRFYLLPSVTPTAAERRAIEKGRAELCRGEYLTLSELHAELDRLDLVKRDKKHPARPASRTRPTARGTRSLGARSRRA